MAKERKYKRANINTRVRYAIINEANAKNLSEGGICIVTVDKLEKGKNMTIIFSLPDLQNKKIEAFGQVKWSKEITSQKCETGIEFWDVNEEAIQIIKEYVKNQLKKDNKGGI